MTKTLNDTALQQQPFAPTIIIGAILSYNNPLHHPTQGIQAWAMANSKPINYRSEIEPTEDQRIRDNRSVKNESKEEDPEIEKPKKEDENIPVPDTEEGDPEDLPDTEDPNEAHDDVDEL